MVLEYEAVCCDPRQRIESGLEEEEVRKVIDTLCGASEAAVPRYQWRPQLRDPNAEKLSAMKTAELFAERHANADPEAAISILTRDGGQPPEPEDRIPDSNSHGNT